MVFGELSHLSVAHEINPGVADMTDQIARFGQQQCGYGASHSQLVTLGASPLEYGAVGSAQGTRNSLKGIRRLEVVQVGELVAHHLDRHLTGDLAGSMPTHSVRDYE